MSIMQSDNVSTWTQPTRPHSSGVSACVLGLKVSPVALVPSGKTPVPSTNMFRVAAGSCTLMPSMALVRWTWQPRRDVSESPKAMSSMSFSSSPGSSSAS
jgi:hypothetical protein